MNSLTLDTSMLSDLYGGSDEDVRFILNDYLARHGDILVSLGDAFGSGIEALTKSVHFHSPSFSYIGLPQLTAECRQFEQECKSAGDTRVIERGFRHLIDKIHQSADLIKEELARRERA
jgi:hypothetical protein